ncbi:hypothetical protein ANAPH2_00614 [Anaplasma phagocytophilum]|nr:hypothetical protein ANAPH2_00614 [Anaplasma phagocytophilum]
MISSPTIDGKVCKTKNGHSSPSSSSSYGTYALETDRSADSKTETALCGGKGGTSGSQATAYQFKDFVANTLKDGSHNWPTSKEKGSSARSEVKSQQNDNAKAVAGDLTKLTPEEKTIVAGLLAKTIEGGEVVEIRAVSSTSVMVNAEFEIIRLFRRESEF